MVVGFIGFEGMILCLTLWPGSLGRQLTWQWEEVAAGCPASAVLCRRS